MTLPEKLAKEDSLAENDHILVKANVSAHKLGVAQFFSVLQFYFGSTGMLQKAYCCF